MISPARLRADSNAMHASIAQLETRIAERHLKVLVQVATCKRDVIDAMTSVPAILSAGVAGFLIGKATADNNRPDATTDHGHQPRTLRNAASLAMRVFTASRPFL